MNNLSEAVAKRFRLPPEPLDYGLPMLVQTNRGGRDGGRRMLAQVLNDVGVKTGLEIGTCRAESALLWCENIPGLKLTCVDPYMTYTAIPKERRQERNYERAKRAIADSGYDIDLWRMTSSEAATKIDDESVDFLHIDGDHRFDAVMMDILLHVPKVKRDGIVVLHDYFRCWGAGVVEAIDSYTRHHGIDPWYVTYDFAPTAFWQRSDESV